MKVYSQNQEQQAILNYFGSNIGTFCDIGANDGVTFSNVRALAEIGWRGCFVEPSPKAFRKLKENYNGLSGFYFYNFAISDHNGRMILHESGPLCNTHDVALVSTRHQREMDRFKATVQYEPVEVKCFRWKTFMNRSWIKQFDFISIDAEGEDKEILSQMDFSNVKCVCVEWNLNPELKFHFTKMLSGFRQIYESAENLIFAR